MIRNTTILTRAKASGKTTMLMNYCNTRSSTSGILTPIINGKRMFYDIVNKDLFDMEYRNENVDDNPIAVGKYLFSNNAFQKAITILNNAISSEIIIDEIGPLELNNQGFSDTLKTILARDFHNILLVVRDGLVSDITNYFGIKDAKIIDDIANIKKT